MTTFAIIVHEEESMRAIAVERTHGILARATLT